MKITNYVSRAVKELCPEGEFGVRNDDINTLEWIDPIIPAPKKEDILAKVEEIKQRDKDESYKQIRARNYPSIGDQLDALYHAGVFPKEMADKIAEVKNRYPKDMIITE